MTFLFVTRCLVLDQPFLFEEGEELWIVVVKILERKKNTWQKLAKELPLDNGSSVMLSREEMREWMQALGKKCFS